MITTCQHVFCSCILEHFETVEIDDEAKCPICATFALKIRRFNKKTIGDRENIIIPE